MAAESRPAEYTLRLVFEGLVTFVAPDRSKKVPRDKGLWVLLGNARDPKKLLVGRPSEVLAGGTARASSGGIPPHVSMMLIQESVKVQGRGLENQAPARHPHLGLGRRWRHVDLLNEDLRLDAVNLDDLQQTAKTFPVVRGTRRLPNPCIPILTRGCTMKKARTQREDFDWTVDVDQALSLIPPVPGERPGDRKIRNCLTTPSFSCQDPHPLLAARFKIDQGRVFVPRLLKEGLNRYSMHKLVAKKGNVQDLGESAIAREVAVEMRVRGPVRLVSSPLDGKGQAKQAITVTGRPGQVVVIRFVNHPKCSPADCLELGFVDNDFLFNFNLINKPTFVGQEHLPVPENQDGDSAWNGQCSPGAFVSGN